MFDPQMENLVESGLRQSCTVSEHSDELRTLALEVSRDVDLSPASEVFAALSNPDRLVILRMLAPRELCVCELSFALRMTQPTTSHHLGILERAGLVEAQPKGRWTFYRIPDPRVLRLVDAGIGLIHRRSGAPPRLQKDRLGTRPFPRARPG